MDNVVFRLGIAPSRDAARQLVTHGHFAVNGRPTNIPSYQLKPGDTIAVRESRRDREPFKVAKENLRSVSVPEWLTLDPATLTGTIAAAPRRDQMPLELNEQLVVEYYSR
jgi:small subunit ribosomal protein S4